MMARAESAGGGETAATKTSTFDPKKAPDFVKRFENVQAQIDEIMAAARDEAAPLYEDLDQIKKEAHEAGLPRKELNSLISKRKALRKADGVRAKLTKEQQDNFDAMEKEMGGFAETPLGGAALTVVRPH